MSAKLKHGVWVGNLIACLNRLMGTIFFVPGGDDDYDHE